MTPREGAEYLRVEVDETVRQLNLEARSRARRAVNVLRNSATKVLAGERSGKTGRIPNTGASYTMSAPGEPPAVRTGNLRRNWRQYVLAGESMSGTRITARIKSDMPYSEFLEQGTGKMAARPYKQKVRAGAMPKIHQIYSNL